MKKIVFVFLSVAAVYYLQAQQAVAGVWEGKLNTGAVSLRIVLHINGEAGAYTATMDSPDQGAKGIPVSRVLQMDDSLLLEVAAIGGKLSGKLVNDTVFNGQWMQGGASLPLDLKKLATGQSIADPKRPQTPKPPFAYESNDVIYYNKDKSIQYGATVTKPKGAGPFPALLLLTGSGQQNRDEEIFGHKPFAVIADYLTNKGYVVMRVDDRGVDQTTGDVQYATTKDFADDAMVGLDYLKTLPGVDKTKIGLLGHSEGGMIAEIVAAQRKDVPFVVLLAAPGEPILDLMTEQSRAVLQSSAMTKPQLESYLALRRSLSLVVSLAASELEAHTAATKVLSDWLANTPKDVATASTGIAGDSSKQDFVNKAVEMLYKPWWQFFFRYQPDQYVRKMNTKVLALNGDKDIQVFSKTNLPALKASLQKSPSKTFETVELKGLNHLFQHCIKCTVAEYAELEETFAPEALAMISNWLDKNVK